MSRNLCAARGSAAGRIISAEEREMRRAALAASTAAGRGPRGAGGARLRQRGIGRGKRGRLTRLARHQRIGGAADRERAHHQERHVAGALWPGQRCVWTMESKCLSAFRGAIVRLVTFPRGPPSSQACPRPSVGADLGWNRPAIWGISVEELFHDARHPHSQNRQTRRFLSRPRDRRFCWRETRRPLIWRAFFSCYRHWISIRVKLR